ncbi:hypothetical protein SAMN04489761_2356 [Tenacibaculum sp. MAR_2009_124]|uniref:hypothetical protein n=1 Tax=Tenacibaculum sp. MAR_2009_124 TaxID=1250059 RepID=UPI00089AE534|nr:hypothetical protein [Tenacibaculum sp. MAR_2009_124]SEC19916.1 hypothetical protein SAMN04489761_2356 [Tenacibaculum sp. MAR_2009_124]
MKKIIIALTLIVSVNLLGQNSIPLSYYLNETPIHGVKIKTNLPYIDSSQMPTIIIEGYNYGKAQTIGIILNWYVYQGKFVQYSASSYGAYSPPIKLANDGGKVVIFLDSKEYFNRFQIRTYAKGLHVDNVSSYFENWTAVDELLTTSATNVVNVPYKSSNIHGDITMEGHVNIGGNQSKRLRVRHVDGKDFDSTDFDHLYLNHSNGKNVILGSPSKPSSLYSYGIVTGHGRANVMADNGTGYVASRIYLNSHNDYRGAGVFSKGQTNNWFVGNPYTDHANGFMIGVAPNTEHEDIAATKAKAKFFINSSGDVGIGTTTPGAKLAVDGRVLAKEVKVSITDFPDYVFENDYELLSLQQVERYIQEKGHLPNIPSAKEVEENEGIDLGDMQKNLLEKIEELTLYTIQQEKKLSKQNQLIKTNKKERKELIRLIHDLNNRVKQLENN